MKFYDSDEFTPLDADQAPTSEPLVVHRHRGVVSPNLVVFIHGLGGKRYGTWGNFPKYLFEDFQQTGVDVGLYWYRTLFRRLRLTASIELDREATVLADVIRELPTPYRRVVLVAHSMGGLLAKSAVKSLIDRDERTALDRIAGLILMATPQAGSLRIPSLFARFSRDARALQPHGRLVTSIVETFTDRVAQEGVSGTGRFVIPAWAVVAPEDMWVDRLSAGLQIPSRRRKEVRGSHTSIVKPAHRDADAYRFVQRAIAECFTDVGATTSTPTTTPFANRPRARSGAVDAGSLGVAMQSSSPMSFVGALQADLTAQTKSHSAEFAVPGAALMPEAPARPVQAAAEALLAELLSRPMAGREPALDLPVQAKPRVDELFEIITDPDEVPKALFGTERTTGVAPYEVDYVKSREGLADVREAMEEALRETRGRLLVCGREGIGKTREIAELARAACVRHWKVLVPRRDADSRLGPLFTMTPELMDARVLIVIDNIHNRMLNAAGERVPYTDRLEQFLSSLESHRPNDVRVLLSARDEPHFQRQLGLPPGKEPWRTFGLFRLPELTGEGLQRILTTLAARAGVALEADDVAKLVENSDRKAETLFINVDLARRNGTALSPSVWMPTEGESWRERFSSAGARQPDVEAVCRALRLLIDAGVPARTPYVAAVAAAAGARMPQAAIDTLVLDGLLGLRQGTLAPFSAEQLDGLLGERTAGRAPLADEWLILAQTITDSATRPNEWVADLLTLAESLGRANRTDEAEQVATRAIELGVGGSRAYRIRVAVRFGRLQLAEVEADLATAIAIDPEEKDLYFVRGATRNLRANFIGALEDLDLAVRYGRPDDAMIHSLRGAAYYQLGRWPEAGPELSAAIERGDTSGTTYFARGMVRFSANEYAAAEDDFTAALAQGFGLDEVVKQLRAVEAGTASFGEVVFDAAEPTPKQILRFAQDDRHGAQDDRHGAQDDRHGAQDDRHGARDDRDAAQDDGHAAPKSGNSDFMVYALRGLTRLILGKAALAEEDLTQALAHGFGERFRSFAATLEGSNLPTLARARDQLSAVPGTLGDGTILQARGHARLAQDKPAEAEADFDAAIAAGYNAPDVYFARATARLRLEKLDGAERDATVLIDRGPAEVATLSLRGVVRLGLQKPAGAEADFDAAIALGRDDSTVFLWRAMARAQQQKLQETEQDLTTAIERDPANADALYRRGCIRCDLEKYADAEADLSAALALGYDPVGLFTFRALARLEQGRVAEAEEDVAVVFARGEPDMHVQSLRGGIRLFQERFDEAEEAFTAAMNLGRNDAWVRMNRGLARERLERAAEAEEDFDAVIDLGVRDAGLFFRRARMRLAQQKWLAAEEDLQAARDAGEDDAVVHSLLGVSQWEQKRYADAEAAFSLALARADDPVYHRSRGHVRLIRGDLSGAEADFEATLAQTPNDVEAHRLRGFARYAEGRNEEALSDFATVLSSAPNNAGYLASCVLVKLRLGRMPEALADLRAAQAADPESLDTAGGDAAMHLAQGDVDGALSRFTALAERDPDWNSWQGLAALMAGQVADARLAYERYAAIATPGDILIAISDLECELQQHPGRPASPEGQAAVGSIRTTLRGKARPLLV